MINRSLMIIGFFLLGLALTASANAAPGQRYVVQKDNTKVYRAPTTNSAVVTRLNKGDRVIEWRRQGSWVNISQLGAVGKDGWVKLSRLRTEALEIEIEISPNNQFLVRALVSAAWPVSLSVGKVNSGGPSSARLWRAAMGDPASTAPMASVNATWDRKRNG